MIDSEEQSETLSYQPAMDLTRFRQFIRDAEHGNPASCDAQHVKDMYKSSASNVKYNGMFVCHVIHS